jgi:hypothetical protein
MPFLVHSKISAPLVADIQQISLHKPEEISAYSQLLLGGFRRDRSGAKVMTHSTTRNVVFLGSCKIAHFLFMKLFRIAQWYSAGLWAG